MRLICSWGSCRLCVFYFVLFLRSWSRRAALSSRSIPSRASSRWVSISIFKFTAELTGGERGVAAAGVFVMRLVHEPEFSSVIVKIFVAAGTKKRKLGWYVPSLFSLVVHQCNYAALSRRLWANSLNSHDSNRPDSSPLSLLNSV